MYLHGWLRIVVARIYHFNALSEVLQAAGVRSEEKLVGVRLTRPEPLPKEQIWPLLNICE